MQSRLSQLKNLISDLDSGKTQLPQHTQNAPCEKIESAEPARQPANNLATTTSHLNLLTNDYRKSLLASSEHTPSEQTPISKFLSKSAFGIRKEFEQIRQECDTLDIEQDSMTANSNRSEMLDQKAKLAGAKERLKQLQGLIGKLKNVSSGAEVTAEKSHQLEQKEAAAALEALNELEKQKQQDRLDELKRNKQKLLELLKEKEAESAELAKLCTAFKTNKEVVVAKESAAEEEEEEEGAGDDVEDRFETAENDFGEVLSVGEEYEQNASPSDLLWSQMKRQLNMRENLRSKKQELEELIRVENRIDEGKYNNELRHALLTLIRRSLKKYQKLPMYF